VEEMMLNLYWKTNDQTRNLIPMPFKYEHEFESYVFQNQELLGDVFIIYRQIRTGTKQGVPDMIGVDQDSRICIIEMKNVEVGEDILPQILGYAMWAETNPDSIKAIWLESKHKPEDIELDWDNLDVRAIVVAPSYRPTVRRMANKIGYPVDLIQMQRFTHENDEFLLVEVLTEQPSPKVMGTWDWEYYEKEHGKEAIEPFRKAVNQLSNFVEKNKWDIPSNMNKYYVGFKLGNRVLFGVHWSGTHAWNIRMKIPQEIASAFKGQYWEFQRYDNDFHEALFRPKNKKTAEISELEPLILEAFKFNSGAK
jgi:hypothetical protein